MTFASDSLDNGAMNMSAPERAALAATVGIGDAYLYQCLTGRKAMKPEEAVRVERESEKRLRRWHLRPRDWHLIWPELIGAEGAPAVHEEARNAA